MTFRSLLTAAAATAAALFAQPAVAQKSADTLRAMWMDPVTQIDPYYNS